MISGLLELDLHKGSFEEHFGAIEQNGILAVWMDLPESVQQRRFNGGESFLSRILFPKEYSVLRVGLMNSLSRF